jgi:hypothetical protein
MICVSVEIRESVVTRRVRITAPSIERAMKIAGGGKPGRRVHLLLPALQQLVEDKLLQKEVFFTPETSVRKEAA